QLQFQLPRQGEPRRNSRAPAHGKRISLFGKTFRHDVMRSTCNAKKKPWASAWLFLVCRRLVSAPTATAVVSLLVAVLVGFAIRLFVIFPVAVRRNIPVVGMFEVAVVRWTIAVSATPIAGSVVESVLISVLPRGIRAVTTVSTSAISAAAISATITIAIVIPIPVA